MLFDITDKEIELLKTIILLSEKLNMLFLREEVLIREKEILDNKLDELTKENDILTNQLDELKKK